MMMMNRSMKLLTALLMASTPLAAHAKALDRAEEGGDRRGR